MQVTDVQFDHIDIAWEVPESDGGAKIKQYIIVMKESTQKKYKKVGKTNGKVLAYSITSSITENQEYSVRVYAENEAGVSEMAAELSTDIKVPSKPKEETKPAVEEAVVPTKAKSAEEAPKAPMDEKNAPGAPVNFQTTDVQPDGITLSWQAPESDGGAPVTGYIVVMRDADKEKFKKYAKVNSKTFSIVVDKIKEGHEYFFRVYAENEMGISETAAELPGCITVPKKDKPAAKEVSEV